MRYKNKELKAMAREALRGNYSTLIAAQFLLFLGNFLTDMLLSSVFPGEGRIDSLLYGTCDFILSLIMTIFQAGLCVMLLHVSRGEDYSYKDLLYFLNKNPDRVISAGFIITGISLLTAVPSSLVLLQMPDNIYTDPKETMSWAAMMLGVTAAMNVLKLLLMLPLVLTYWFMCDYDSVGGTDAIKESYYLMKGKKWRYFCLLLSFAPEILLSGLCMGIGMLWVTPYIKVTEAFFYREVTGEALPWYGSRLAWKQEPTEQKHDYNAEG